MSKNFELMRKAGKVVLDLGPPPGAARVERPQHDRVEKVPAIERVARSQQVVPLRRKKRWQGVSHPDHLNVDQLAREEVLRLVQRVFLLPAQASPRVVVFAGVNHGSGCSRICAQVAESLETHGGGPVCLVEGNLRSPALPRIFGAANHHGLTDSLLSDAPIRTFAKPLNTDRLWLLSCGSLAGDSHGLLNSARLMERFEELRNEFAYVVVDAPPLTHYPDAIALGRIADGFVLILEAHSTRREAALRISEHLRSARIPVLGAVLNKRTFPIPDALYRKL